MRTQFVKAYPEDEELLEDVIIENKQAIEMSNIYRDILSGTMDAFASVISNNLNIVMKVLASVTIILTIPSIIFGLWGSNVPVPFETSPYGFWIVIAIAVLFTGAAVVWMLKKNGFEFGRAGRETAFPPGFAFVLRVFSCLLRWRKRSFFASFARKW